MSKRLSPYGVENYTGSFATVGASKAPVRLAEGMPSREAGAKVGIVKVQDGQAAPARRLVRLKSN